MDRDIFQELRELLYEQKKAEADKALIVMSATYRDIKMHIVRLQEQLEDMVEGVPDFTQHIKTLKSDLIKAAPDKAPVGWEYKYKEKNKINNHRVIELVENEDWFMEKAKVTQKDLKDYAKENPLIKAELLDCIEVVSRELSDIIVTE